MEQKEEARITAYSLVEFCQLTEQKIKEGFVFDFENSSRVPVNYGNSIEAILVKEKTKPKKTQEPKAE